VALFAMVSRRDGVAFGSRITRSMYSTGDSPSAGAASGAASRFGAGRRLAGFFGMARAGMKTPGKSSRPPGACFRCAEMHRPFDQTGQSKIAGVAERFAFSRNRSRKVAGTLPFRCHFA